MLFSVIIPTHKRFEKLQRAVQSVVSQSYSNKQIIVVSDCYDEDTAKICSMLDGKEDVLIMKKNAKGPSESRNIGIEHARGDVIMFLDDDDRYEIDYLEKIHREMTKDAYSQNEILYCNYEVIFNEDYEKREVRDTGKIPFHYLFVKNFINLVSVAFPIHTIKNKSFDGDIAYEDWEFILQASMGNKIRHVPICGGLKYEYTDGRSQKESNENLISCYRKVYLKYNQVSDVIRSLRNELLPNYEQVKTIVQKQQLNANDVVKHNLHGINSVHGVLKCVFVCWFGGYNNYLVKMSENRTRAFESLVSNINVPVVLIDRENYKSFEVPGNPFHKGFLYLSATHKSDYMRVYMLYHYGGGYHDIKYRNTGWEQEWEKDDWILDDNVWMYGRTEFYSQWIGVKPGEPDIRKFHNSLISMNYIISKKKTPYLKELLEKIHQLLDEKLDKLVKYPGYESGYYNDRLYDPVPEHSYPFRWSEIGAEIHHALMLKYKDHIKHGLPDVDSTKWYR